MAKKRYKYAAGLPGGSPNNSPHGSFSEKLAGVFRAVGAFIGRCCSAVKDLAASVAAMLGSRRGAPGAAGSQSDYERRRAEKQKRQRRNEKLVLAATLILPLIFAVGVTAACLNEGCFSSCSCDCSDNVDKKPDVPLTKQEKELRELFDEAEEIYSWFTGCNEPRYDESDSVAGQYDGELYYRVTERGIADMAELRALVGEHFTGELADKLLDTRVYESVELFKDVDGALYVYGGFAGQASWDIGERVGRISSQSDAEIVYSMEMSYEYYSYTFTAEFDYLYVLCEDGKWRFSRFELPAVLLAETMYGGTE